jgi:hypothetical protein
LDDDDVDNDEEVVVAAEVEWGTDLILILCIQPSLLFL